jgi:metallophosphoesterase (TIGR00282 family)
LLLSKKNKNNDKTDINVRLLYLGDVMGKPGRQVVSALLPKLRTQYKPDIIVAQAENVSHGKSITPQHMRELQAFGIDFFTGGNHTIERPATLSLLENPAEPIIAPLNQVGVESTWGTKTLQTTEGPLRFISLLGTTFPIVEPLASNPLQAIDQVLAESDAKITTIVNFHGDFSSEKRVIGYYLDGRVAAVIGDHWHVPTADAMILPDGTAHITDVGMCGTLHSSLGVQKELIIKRWRDDAKGRNEMAEDGPFQLNAVLVTIDMKRGSATSIESINKIIDEL